jgi:hypothetical protein
MFKGIEIRDGVVFYRDEKGNHVTFPRQKEASYHVRRVGSSADGTQWFCNVAYDDNGVCLGGDAHWLTPGAADVALLKRMRAVWSDEAGFWPFS